MKHLLPDGKMRMQISKKLPAIVFVIILMISRIGVKAQVVIPDPNFKAYLQANFPACMSGNILDTTCTGILNQVNLAIPGSNIQDLTGIQYFDNLQSLECHDNLLTSLPKLPAGLNFLNINNNLFAVLPELPADLGQLYCSNNLLTSLPALPVNLNVLSCGNNQIASLPALPLSLSFLGVGSNLLSSLPALPVGLNNLVVSDNQFTALPALPSTLKSLICNNNFLTSLPALPFGLTELKCATNLLQTLPPLPPNLDYLGCATNQLISLPALPVSLNTLSAHDNLLTELPPFPPLSFSCSVDISDNPISCIPFLPDSVQLIFCNTPIECMPNIPAGATFFNCNEPLPPVCSGTDECLSYNVSGYSFEDLNNNCVFDAGEPPLAGRVIKINNGQYLAYTDSNGYYTFYSGLPGSYQLSQVNSNPVLWDLPCNGNIQSITIVNPLDTFNNRNFPNQILSYCALPSVDIATGAQRLCFSDNTYTVSYCNQGTLSAFNSYINIEFDPEVIPKSSTLPWTSVDGNIYRFDVGAIAPGECRVFTIIDSISCDAILDQTACVKANIFPDTTCATVNPAWDHSDLQVTGGCNGTNDSTVFVVKNVGTGDMLSSNLTTIYEDDLLMGIVTTQLNSGDSITITVAATGTTYRVETKQNTGHPGNSQPRSFVELCGTGPYSLDKIIPVVQDDADQWVEIDCHLITGSFDPNEKSVQPSGVGPQHLITDDDDLDYIIQFQNTGTDTAFNVLLIDTIDIQHLDITSIQPGPSSDAYTFSLQGTNVAKFAFDEIHLPDSTTNEPASHGFVKYKIRQKQGNPPGAVINNFAGIYFDYNDPVLTNTAFVTIADKDSIFPTSDHPLLLQKGYSITVSPNPFEQFVRFEIDATMLQRNYSIRLYDVLGNEIYRSPKVHASSFSIKPPAGEAGIYFYRIYNDAELIGTGKLIHQ